MAQIAEKQQDFAAANAWLDRIENADDIMAAQMRRASLLARQGKMAQARALLRSQPERRPEDARLKLVAEAQLLRDFKAWKEAYEVYGEAVARFPDEHRSALRPGHDGREGGQAWTTWSVLLRAVHRGQTRFPPRLQRAGLLAGRPQRAPARSQEADRKSGGTGSPTTPTSRTAWAGWNSGWATRRERVEILQAAYGKRPDPEIAAHLGEVLWTQGQRDQALKIWREGLLLSSDNETLQGTLKRLRVKP